MNKAVRVDLADAADAIEHLRELLPTMSLKDKVDACARLRGAAKTIAEFDKNVKDDIKLTLDNKDGILNGAIFKAILKYNKVTRLNQSALKEQRPKIYEQFLETKDEPRITFETR